MGAVRLRMVSVRSPPQDRSTLDAGRGRHLREFLIPLPRDGERLTECRSPAAWLE
jgi:hypothetical protein